MTGSPIDRITEMVARRAELVAELAELDAVFERLSGVLGAAPTKRTKVSNEGPPPAIRRATKEKAEPSSKQDRIRDEIDGLRDFFGELSDRQRKVVELRAQGKLPEAIAKALKIEPSNASQVVYQATIKLRKAREARTSSGKTTAASDSDEDPEPAEADGEDLTDWSEFGFRDEPTAPVAASTPVMVPDLTPPPPARPSLNDMETEDAQPELARIRRRLKVLQPEGRMRSKTIRTKRLTRAERANGDDLDIPDGERPLTRADCIDGPRPCPWIGCRHHLYVEVNADTGTLKFNFPHLELEQMPETCSLDVADRGGITLEEVGAIVNLTRERVRQIETAGIDAARDFPHEEAPDRFGSPLAEAIVG